MLWADKRALETNLKVQLLPSASGSSSSTCQHADDLRGRDDFGFVHDDDGGGALRLPGWGAHAVRVLYMVWCMSSLGFMFVA